MEQGAKMKIIPLSKATHFNLMLGDLGNILALVLGGGCPTCLIPGEEWKVSNPHKAGREVFIQKNFCTCMKFGPISEGFSSLQLLQDSTTDSSCAAREVFFGEVGNEPLLFIPACSEPQPLPPCRWYRQDIQDIQSQSDGIVWVRRDNKIIQSHPLP